MRTPTQCPSVFILDVDGVMTDGAFYYTPEGKVMKKFGADDHDALTLLAPHMEILFVTGDKRGFGIAQKRIADDMKMALHLVSTARRIEWIEQRYPLDRVVYMGDGVFDVLVFERVAFGIAPANASSFTRRAADFVTSCVGGQRAVAEACFFLLEHFFRLTDLHDIMRAIDKTAGQWTV